MAFQLIYHLTTSLLIPVVAGLAALMAWSVFQAGVLAGSWRERRRAGPAERWRAWREGVSTFPADFLIAVELEMTRRLTRLRWAVRVAPMLGLMGTLIPLGPALTEFSEGNVQAASAHVVIAFGTTVLGLAAAVVNYTAWHIHKTWYAYDLLELEAAFHDACDVRTSDSGTSETPQETPLG